MPIAAIGIVIALLVVIAYNTIKILKEYERGVIFFLGRYQSVKGPTPRPRHTKDDQSRPARHRHGRTDPGRHFAGQRLSQS